MAMTKAKLTQVLDRYETMLTSKYPDLEPERHVGELDDDEIEGGNQIVRHLMFTVRGARELLEQPERREKLMRHLGFIQGVLWTVGLYTVEELMHHNMPDPQEVS